MSAVADLTAAGYDVEEAFQTEDGVSVYHVSGHGAACYVRGDDTDAVARLVASATAPPPDPGSVDLPTPQGVAAQMAQTITSAVQGVPAGGTVSDLQAAIVTALAPYLAAG